MCAFAVLSYSESDNLGDEIQSIAAAQFLPRVDATVDRDHLRLDTKGRDIDAILNGWFLAGEEWPPPDALHPLVVSFYAPAECTRVYDRRHLEWYRRHEPIGCRSSAFARNIEAIGVRAYFSGCLSLCLPPAPMERGAEVCVVDCDTNLLRRLVPVHVLERATFLSHVDRTDARGLSRRIAKRALRELRPHAPRLVWSIAAAYRRRRHAERTARARALLDRYARARLVITGRLHCFLPCLALGTPVLLLHSPADAHRLGGLAELGRAYTERDQRIDLDWSNPDPNPGDHRPLAAALAERCRTWVASRTR
jgi:polysaccharide pyruvyl transferase